MHALIQTSITNPNRARRIEKKRQLKMEKRLAAGNVSWTAEQLQRMTLSEIVEGLGMDREEMVEGDDDHADTTSVLDAAALALRQ